MFGFPFGFQSGSAEGQQYQDQDGYGEQEQINNTEYYQILGVEQNASAQQIKTSYQKLVTQLDPDTSPQDAQKLKLINQAYDTLKDQQKRAIYDQYGKDDQNQNQQTGHGNDLLNMFFGGGQKKGKNQKPKMKDTQQLFQVTLQNIYNGDVVQFQHTRTRCCQKCKGKGGQNVKQCQKCQGQGRVIQMFQVGPGAYQQMQKICENCSGKGQFLKQQDKCTGCDGKKILQRQKTLKVTLQRGTPNNFSIVIKGQGNQIPDALPGDLILVVKQKQHEIFKRQGADLFAKKDVSLLQALTGFQFTIKHLDGVQYTFYTSEGQIIQDQAKRTIKGLGMPLHKTPEQFGNLIIQFHVIMPKRQQLSKQQLKQLLQILPGQINERPKQQDYHMFQDFDIQNLNRNQQGGKLPQDQYNQEEGQGQYCATQ